MGVRIRQAEAEDREQVVRLLDEAFHHDPVSGWVFPDEAHRRAVHGKFLGVFVDVTLAEGRIDLLEDGTAVALWLPVPAGAPTEEDTTPALMRATARTPTTSAPSWWGGSRARSTRTTGPTSICS